MKAVIATLLAASFLVPFGSCQSEEGQIAPEKARRESGSEYDGVETRAASSPTASTEAGAVEVTVRESTSIHPFNRDLLGYNFDWRASENIFISPQGSRQDSDVIALLSGVNFPLNRVAGSDSQHFRWKQCIGPLAQREPQKLWSWQDAAPLRFGPVEFLQTTLRLDPRAKFIWVLNLAQDSPADMADLAEFLKGDGLENPNGAENWAKQRIDQGLTTPVDIAIWEVGNEMDWSENQWTVERYIEAAREAMRAVRSVDPRAKFALHAKTAPWVGSKEPWRKWHRTVLKELGTDFDYLVLHPYYLGLPIASIEKYLDSLRDDIKQLTGSDRIKVLISEHGRWPKKNPEGEWSQNFFQTHSLEGSLATAMFVVRCMHRPEVAAATYHSFSSGPWGLIYRDKETGQLYTTGIAKVFRLFGKIGDGVVVKTDLAGRSTDPSQDDYTFSAIAIKRDHGLDLVVVNLGTERSVTLNAEQSYLLEEAAVLTAPDLNAHATAEGPGLSLEDASEPLRGRPLQTFIVPAHSAMILKSSLSATAP